MKVCEKTRGWPSTQRIGVSCGLADGPRPWITFPDTVINNDGGWAPKREPCRHKGQLLRLERLAYLELDGSQMTALHAL